MIKPSQIREKEFSKSTMGGYKTSDVDNFLDEVAASYEQLYKENSELLKKLRLLVDNIEDYRRREQSGDIIPDDVITQARAQADKIIADAKQEAERIVSNAGNRFSEQSVDEIRKLREKEEKALADVREESEKFRQSLLSMYTEHLTLIQSMVAIEPVEEPQVISEPEVENENANEMEPEVETEKIYETKLDINNIEVDGTFTYDDIDAFFADAVQDEQSRIREAFGGFRFEMGVEPDVDVQLGFEETVSEFEEPDCFDEQENSDSDAAVESSDGEASFEQGEKTDDSAEIKPSFKVSFPEDEEASDNEEENLDDLFEGFFKSTDKPE